MRFAILLPAALGGLAAVLVAPARALPAPAIFVNQVAYDTRGPVIAVIRVDAPLPAAAAASLIDEASGAVRATVPLGAGSDLGEWAPGKLFHRAEFTGVAPGTYRVRVAGTSS